MRAVLEQLPPHRAVCAVNVENYDTLVPTLRAANDAEAPVVLAVSVPVAHSFGMKDLLRLVDLTAERTGGNYAVHLDHCERVEDAEQAISAGFTSINYLDEGAVGPTAYERNAVLLRERYGADVAFEFVLGTLGQSAGAAHSGHGESGGHHGHSDRALNPSAVEVVRFASITVPDILGFQCGSLHGMRERERLLDVDLIRSVSTKTRLPIVLHGSSGVTIEGIHEGVEAGIRKINVESALRKVYMDTVRAQSTGDGPAAHKPRHLSNYIQSAVQKAVIDLMNRYTLSANVTAAGVIS